MGIPRLYSILMLQWPSLVETPALQDNCDALFLDMSSFLHACLSLSSNEDEMVLLVEQFISRLINISGPKQRVFMAFDGVPPLAKLKEQFERRRKTTGSSLLNPHILTPGTPTLQRLESSVIKFARELVLEKDDSSFDIVISGPSVPGEGEQKIMRHIEFMKEKKHVQKVVIYGMDADLIVMGMSMSTPDVYILRECSTSRGSPIASKKFEFFSIPRLRAKIWLNYLSPTEEEMNDIMRDIGFLFTVFGNDFTPTPDGLELSKTTFMKYVEMLRPIHRQKRVLVKDGLLQFDGIYLLLKEMAKEEQINFKVKNPIKQTLLSTRVLELQLAGLSLKEKKSTVKAFTEQVEDERFMNWRHSYYNTTYKTKSTEIIDICQDYLKTMSWVTQYYTDGNHTTWSYDYKFTPRLTDILLHCKEIPEADRVSTGLEFGPLHQLAVVLPEKFDHLLPMVYRDCDNLKELLSLRYSSSDAFRQENIQKMVDIMKCLDDNLTDGERQRNTKGKPVRIFLGVGGSESGTSTINSQQVDC